MISLELGLWSNPCLPFLCLALTKFEPHFLLLVDRHIECEMMKNTKQFITGFLVIMKSTDKKLFSLQLLALTDCFVGTWQLNLVGVITMSVHIYIIIMYACPNIYLINHNNHISEYNTEKPFTNIWQINLYVYSMEDKKCSWNCDIFLKIFIKSNSNPLCAFKNFHFCNKMNFSHSLT